MSSIQEDIQKDSPSDAVAGKSTESPNPSCKERRKSQKKKFRSTGTSKRRLGGGADLEPGESANDAAAVKEEDDQNRNSLQAETAAEGMPSQAPAVASNTRQPLSSTGDPRVDEMLECALENLEEAGKALASLGENLEHELKVPAGRSSRSRRRQRKHE